MDKTAIYRKTDLGVAEITTTRRTVDMKLRPLLILIDGRRTAQRIHSLLGGVGIREEHFDDLEGGGYIEIMRRPDPVAVSEAAANDPRRAEADESDPAIAVRRFSEGQRYMTETVADKLGLRSFLFVLKIEKCSGANDLIALLPEFEKAIAKRLDADYARHCRRIAQTILTQ